MFAGQLKKIFIDLSYKIHNLNIICDPIVHKWSLLIINNNPNLNWGWSVAVGSRRSAAPGRALTGACVKASSSSFHPDSHHVPFTRSIMTEMGYFMIYK